MAVESSGTVSLFVFLLLLSLPTPNYFNLLIGPLSELNKSLIVDLVGNCGVGIGSGSIFLFYKFFLYIIH